MVGGWCTRRVLATLGWGIYNGGHEPRTAGCGRKGGAAVRRRASFEWFARALIGAAGGGRREAPLHEQ